MTFLYLLFDLFSFLDMVSDYILSGVYWFNVSGGYGLLTFSFLYFPSGFTVAAIFGPRVAGWCSIAWGTLVLLADIIQEYTTDAHWYVDDMLLLNGGVSMLLVGLVLIYQQWGNNESRSSKVEFCGSTTLNFVSKFLLFPFLFLLSPLIFLYIKFLSIIKRENKMIQCQKEMTSMAEALLEATPQYCLQLGIVIHQAVYPTWPQWFSLITSLIALNIPIIQKYFQHITCEPFQWKNAKKTIIIKRVTRNCLLHILVLLFNNCGKIICMTILFESNLHILTYYLGPLLVLLTIQIDLFNLRQEKDFYQQRLEGILLGFVNQSNLTNSRSAKMNRMFVFYFSFIFNVIYVSTNVGIANAKDTTDNVILNICSSLGLGFLLISWILDIICQNISDYGGVYHSSWREFMNPKWNEFLMYWKKAIRGNDSLLTITFLCYCFLIPASSCNNH